MSSVVRAMRILELLAARAEPVSLATVAQELAIPKSTAHGILADLLDEGFVEAHPPAGYTVGIRAFEVGAGHLRVRGVEGLVTGELARLSRSLDVTAHYAVLDGADVVYLAKEDPPGLGLRLASSVGARLPAARTAVGKAALAWLDPELVAEHVGTGGRVPAVVGSDLADVRATGYATDDGATAAAIMCVAAPVFGPRGPRGAIGVSYLRDGDLEVEQVGAQVREAAARATATVGGRFVA